MKIAISTSGGDAPGLNSVIAAVTRSARNRGHEVVGLRRGFSTLLAGEPPLVLTEKMVDGIERTGGTILGAESRGDPFTGDPDALTRLVAILRRNGVDALIMAGGDGTMAIAKKVHDAGMPVVGVPKTIDRDVAETLTTFGHDTAAATATEALDRLHSTTASHDRLMVVEVMGRDSGWLALYTAIAGGACGVALPEFPYMPEAFAEHIRRREERGYAYHILVCAEGARPAGGEGAHHGRTGRYGGIGEQLAAELERITGKEARSMSLGHLLRGGPPTVNDRVLGMRFGSAAVSAIDSGESGVMIAYVPPGFRSVPLERVVGRVQTVSMDTHEIRTAINMGISLGI
jgi:6-phosphofructokinase 1